MNMCARLLPAIATLSIAAVVVSGCSWTVPDPGDQLGKRKALDPDTMIGALDRHDIVPPVGFEIVEGHSWPVSSGSTPFTIRLDGPMDAFSTTSARSVNKDLSEFQDQNNCGIVADRFNLSDLGIACTKAAKVRLSRSRAKSVDGPLQFDEQALVMVSARPKTQLFVVYAGH